MNSMLDDWTVLIGAPLSPSSPNNYGGRTGGVLLVASSWKRGCGLAGRSDGDGTNRWVAENMEWYRHE